jgi:peptidyl-prolyl cis-trans isomerase SurA
LYFLKIDAYKISDNVSPLEFVKHDIKNIILNKRKVELAKKLEDDVYENAAKRKDFEVFDASLLGSILFFGAPATAQDTGFVVDKIIAKVDNYIVLKSELELAYQAYLSEGNPASEDARCELFNRLILNKLMVAKAEIDSVLVTDVEVDGNTEQRMAMILQNSGNSPEQLERAYGKSLDQIKLELREQIREQLIAREMTSRITKDIKVTPAEIKKFYTKIPQDSLPFYSSDVEVAQIVRVAKVSADQEDEARKKLSRPPRENFKW